MIRLPIHRWLLLLKEIVAPLRHVRQFYRRQRFPFSECARIWVRSLWLCSRACALAHVWTTTTTTLHGNDTREWHCDNFKRCRCYLYRVNALRRTHARTHTSTSHDQSSRKMCENCAALTSDVHKSRRRRVDASAHGNDRGMCSRVCI